MLENIRGIAHNKLFKIFFFLLAAIFAVSLGNFNNSSAKDNIVASVGKEKISLNDFKKARQAEINNLITLQHLAPEEAQQHANQINSLTLNKLISQSLIKQELKHLGVEIPYEVIADYIHSDPSFQKNGTFDPQTYKELLEQNNVSEETLLKSIADQISAKFLVNSLTATTPLKNIVTSYIRNFLLEKRKAAIINVDMTNYQFDNIEEAKLKEFYSNNPNFFQSQEARDFTLILLNKSCVKISSKINDEALKEEYENHLFDYTSPPKVDVYHFLTPDKQTANEVEEALKQDSDHIKIAKNFVSRKVIGELFLNQDNSSFLATIDKTIFSTPENHITKVVKSELGWHVFKIIKQHPKVTQEFEKVKDKVKENLEEKLYEHEIYELSKQVEDEIASGAEFDEIAKKFGVKSVSYKSITRDGKDVDSKIINLNPSILNIAFEYPENEESGFKVLDNNHDRYVVKVDKITPPSLVPFEKIKDKVKQVYIADLKQKLAGEIANNLANELNKPNQNIFSVENSSFDNAKLNSIALEIINKKFKDAKQKYIVNISIKEVNRSDNQSDIPNILFNAIFSLPLNKPSMAFAIAPGNYALTIPLSSSASKNVNPEIIRQAEYVSEMNYKNEISEEYLDYLKKKFPININTKLIENKNND